MPQDPFLSLIEQMAALLKMAEKNSSKSLEGEVDPTILAKLDQVSKEVGLLKEAAGKVLANEKGEVQEQVEKWVKNPKEQSKEKKVFEQFLGLGLQAFLMKKQLEQVQQKAGIDAQGKVKGGKKAIQQRKGRFKKMGGDKWKRL